ncbi:MAG: hypothetical protein Q8862_04560 [Bacteroidota bacterium]|nr:hypothetical protein [Bacteroidota bacterium]MDP4206292.1 hypothetical protein [Bacteroidota bacterium]
MKKMLLIPPEGVEGPVVNIFNVDYINFNESEIEFFKVSLSVSINDNSLEFDHPSDIMAKWNAIEGDEKSIENLRLATQYIKKIFGVYIEPTINTQNFLQEDYPLDDSFETFDI